MGTLIHEDLRKGLEKPVVQDLLLISLTAGILSSVASYWALNDARGQSRMPSTNALLKATLIGFVSTGAGIYLESLLLEQELAQK
jgi:hypothetical protein